MPRLFALVGTVSLFAVLLNPLGTAQAALQPPPDTTPFVDGPTALIPAVQPDKTYNSGGARVEIYTSVGDNDGLKADWRHTNAYAYLVSSVPARSHIYSTIYNTLWDGDKARLRGDNQWEMVKADGAVRTSSMFAPSAAFLKQVNQYTNSADRLEFINVLGNRSTIDEAVRPENGSGLASLLKASEKNDKNRALNYNFCTKGSGACLSTVKSGENLMHAKYAAFEQAKDSTGTMRSNVTWITSSNLNGSSGGKKSNVSIAIYGDQKAFQGIRDIYAAEVSETFTAKFKAAMVNGIEGDSGVTLYPSPRSLKPPSTEADVAAVDVEAKFLNSALAAPGKSDCRVYSVHSLFSGARSGILDALGGLEAQQQCDVKVVLGENALAEVVDTYFAMSTSLREVIDRVEFANVHDKTLAVSYASGGVRTAKTFGGSANFNGTSLEYDELAFASDNSDMTQTVAEHSERIYDLARGRTTVTRPEQVAVVPASSADKRLNVVRGQSVKFGTKVTPANALVTNTAWTSSDPTVATVDATGKVTGMAAGTAQITTTVTSRAGSPSPTGVGYVTVVESGTTSPGDTTETYDVTTPPVLTMDRYQPPPAVGGTDVVVTWGQGSTELDGIVKMQYYGGGAWNTYGGENEWIIVRDGVGRKNFRFKGSHTWRAISARVDSGDVPNTGTLDPDTRTSTGYAINTVRTATATSTPRIYVTDVVKSGGVVPFLLTWKTGGTSTVRLQYDSGKKWITKGSYVLEGDTSQVLVGVPVVSTHKWRVATSPKSGSSKTSSPKTVTTKKTL